MSSLLQARDHLDNSWKALRLQWQAALTLWNDPVSRHFERDYWQEFERVVSATSEEMRNLAQILAQARRSVR